MVALAKPVAVRVVPGEIQVMLVETEQQEVRARMAFLVLLDNRAPLDNILYLNKLEMEPTVLEAKAVLAAAAAAVNTVFSA